MRATKLLVASLISVVGLLAGCATAPSEKAIETKPIVATVPEKPFPEFPIELTAPQIDLGNIYTVMQQDVKELKQRAESKPKLVSKPVSVKTAKVTAVKPVSVAKPEPITEIKPPATAPPTAKLPTLPKNSIALIPILKRLLDALWPTIPYKSYMGSKIEQETCISLTHSKCWSSRAELKTNREYGFGLGQTTIAYNKDGTERFNVWQDLIKLDPELKKKWTWDNRFDAELQLRATVIKSKSSFDSIRFDVFDVTERLAFASVTYNSGSVLIDRRLCIDKKGCDPSKWFGNVELYSTKSKIAQKGYGKSFYEISREYPRNVLFVRRPKYIPYMDN